MCVKIICTDHEHEFNPSEPLENQLSGAHEVIVSYDPLDPKIASFIGQVELMVKNGVSCEANIKFNANNYLNGMKLERHIDKLKLALETNEVVKNLTKIHASTDRRLREIAEMCLTGKTNE